VEKVLMVIGTPVILSGLVWLLHVAIGSDLFSSIREIIKGKDLEEAKGGIKEKISESVRESLIELPIDVMLLSSSILLEILLSFKSVIAGVTIFLVYIGTLIIVICISRMCSDFWKENQQTKRISLTLTKATIIFVSIFLVVLFLIWLFLSKG